MKTVYIAMSADIVHNGHMNILKEGEKYGSVIVGLLTDEAIASYKRMPMLNYEQRKAIFENFKQVSQVVPQYTLSYRENLEKYRPDYVLHGDDWRTGIQSIVREEVLRVLGEYGGQLIEVPYTTGVSGTDLDYQIRKQNETPELRRAALRRILQVKGHAIAMEASNGLTGLIVENTFVANTDNVQRKEFDAMWVSSLCDSTCKGKPDIELVDLTSRLTTIQEIMDVTTKPIILDGDTGGKQEHFAYNVRTLERMGISAVIIEDKTGMKQNSLFGTDARQVLEDPAVFAAKIHAGKNAQSTRDFMIIARLESLIAGQGVDDAMERAKRYLEDGGADGIMIHSRYKDGKEICAFMEKFRQYAADVPVVLVPTSYNQFHETELYAMGANIIIYANHMMRSAYPAMVKTAETILRCGRSLEADEYCLPIKQVLQIIPGEVQ